MYKQNNYQVKKPFSSFLSGISGKNGIPMWAYYINRGQVISSFGLENKNGSLLAKALARNLYRQDGIVNSGNEITKFVLTLSEELESLKMDYVMSEEFDMNDLVTSCLKSENE